MKKAYSIWIILFILSISFIYAGQDEVYYALRTAKVECRANWTYDFRSALVQSSGYTEINISSDIPAIRREINKLKNYDWEDRQEFNLYVTGVNPLINSMLNKLSLAKKDIVTNIMADKTITQTEKNNRIAHINEIFQSGKRNYTICAFRTTRRMAVFQQRELNSTILLWSNSINKLSGANYNVSGMREVMRNVTKYKNWQTRVITAKNVTEQNKYLSLINSAHFHIYARFNIARLRSYIDEMRADAIAKGFRGRVQEIDTLLSEAAYLARLGHRYEANELELVWTKIPLAAYKIRDLARDINWDWRFT